MSERNPRYQKVIEQELFEDQKNGWKKLDNNVEQLSDFGVTIHDAESIENGRLLIMVEDWCKEASQHFTTALKQVIKRMQTSNQPIPDSIIKYFLEKEWDKPMFNIYGPRQGIEWLHRMGFIRTEVDPKSVVIVFNLPKPMALFWHKTGVDYSGRTTEGAGGAGITEWGHMYERAIWGIRDSVDTLNDNDDSKFSIKRINEPRRHDIKNYYYIWTAKETRHK